MKVLELYSGIGGMHLALKESGIDGEIVAAIDINNTANLIYNNNFAGTQLMNKNISGLTADVINKLCVDTILMSPPCQPFTRNGLQNDIRDPRTDSFSHILTLLPQLDIKRILIENVKGFERSEMRNRMIEVLDRLGYIHQEFILSPCQMGVPNTRHRYYCMAVKAPEKFTFQEGPLFSSTVLVRDTHSPSSWRQGLDLDHLLEMKMIEHLPSKPPPEDCYEIKDIIETNRDVEKYVIPEKVLRKRANLLDICYPGSKRSCCFTKSYGRYTEGTGSVYTNVPLPEVKVMFDSLQNFDCDSVEYLQLVDKMKLRYFTPREVARLMCFPDTFQFPEGLSDRQCYAVLGNSVNIKVVATLIKLFK